MGPKLPPLPEHMRLMEDRVKEQAAKMEKLRLAGRDTSAAFVRLSWLQHAMEEMSVQLGCISPTALEAKRENIAAALRTLSKDGKSS